MSPEQLSQTVTSIASPAPGTLVEQVERLIQRLAQADGRVPPEWAELAEPVKQALERDEANRDGTDRRARHQLVILRLGQQALATPDLSKTLDILAREAALTLGADFCSVVQAIDEGKAFVVRATQSGASGLTAPVPLSDAQAAHTLRTPTPIVSPDLATESRFPVSQAALQLGAVSGMSVVVHGPTQAWGVVAAHSKEARRFTADEVHFLEAVGNLMALAVERDRVQTTLRQRNREQAAVALLGRHALGGPHMEDFFREATRAVAETLEVPLCDILQRNGDAKALLLRAGVGWQPGLVGSARIPALPRSQTTFALAADGPVTVADLSNDTRFEQSEVLVDHAVVSCLTVIIPGRHRSYGLLGAYTRTPRRFTLDDSYFMQAVANLLAAAIERHGVEGELRRHRDDLEGLVEERTALLAASNRELEAFSYTISHDLRAPLRSINGLSKIVQRKYGSQLAPKAVELLQLMADETVRMGNLIEAILALSRLGTVEVKHAKVDVSRLATSILDNLQALNPDRRVGWNVDPGVQAIGDEGLLRVLLENLLGNAWKFTRNAANARVELTGFAGGFSVADNGDGFDMAHARELFQPFHRLHTTDEFEGLGIGLATVGRIVNRHGGKVSAQGARGQGATFHVTLPPWAPVPPSSAPGAPQPELHPSSLERPTPPEGRIASR